MSKTKSRIQQKALEIFNEKGVSNTTLRQIALALGMSQGNLNYHFKTKNEIVEALYYELVEQMDKQMNSMIANTSVLQLLNNSSRLSMEVFYNYRFLMRDFFLILRENAKIKTHYLNLVQFRKVQFKEIFNNLIAEQILREEAFINEYERLVERMFILGDNWINSHELFEGNIPNPVDHYHVLLFEVIYPYLTKKGRAIYDQLENQ